MYNLRNCCIRFRDEEIKALIISRIGLDAKILSFRPLIAAMKNGKKFRQGAFRFRIAGLKETIVEVNVDQYLRRLTRTDTYYQYYRTTLSHNWSRCGVFIVKSREASAEEKSIRLPKSLKII